MVQCDIQTPTGAKTFGEICRDTANLLRQAGWNQHVWTEGDQGTPTMCGKAAFNVTCGRLPEVCDEEHSRELNARLTELNAGYKTHFAAKLRECSTARPSAYFTKWNDVGERTAEEVIDAFMSVYEAEQAAIRSALPEQLDAACDDEDLKALFGAPSAPTREPALV